MPIAPIAGMLRRGLVLDLSIAGGLGTTFGYLWWYGFHLPESEPEINSTPNWKMREQEKLGSNK